MTEDDSANESNGSIVSGSVSVNVTDVLGLGKAAAALTPAAIKVCEVAGKSVGAAAEPVLTYLNIRAEGAGHRRNAIENANTAAKLDEILASDPQLAHNMKIRLISTELRRQSNIESAVRQAIMLADQQASEGTAQDVDPDFYSEWLTGVQDVSNADVVGLWSAVLANAPVSDSALPRAALLLLKQFDAVAAKSFENLAKITLHVGPPDLETTEKWGELGVEVDFDLMSELGVLKPQNNFNPKIPVLGKARQSGELLHSNLRLSATPTIRVWAMQNRAVELANAVFSGQFEIDQEFGQKALHLNLSALANDKNQHLQIELSGQYLCQIAHPDNAFIKDLHDPATSRDNQQVFDTASEIEKACSDLPNIQPYQIETLKQFANEGRLEIAERSQEPKHS